MFLITTSFSTSFVLENDNILNDKAIKKIDEMSSELFKLSNISVYVVAKQSISPFNSIKEYEHNITFGIKGNFAVFAFTLNEKKVDIFSNIQNNLYNKDDILDGYVIPILVSKDTNFNKNQAAIFNGFAQLVESISSNLNLELKSSIGSESKNSYDVVKIIIWLMLISFVGIYIYVRRS